MQITVTSKRIGILEKFREIVKFRELLYFFAWRDIKVRYKQTFLGVLWVIIQPVILVTIFSLVFRSTLEEPNEVPYVILTLIGVFFWLLFSNIINTVGNSLVSNQHLIQKVYFPNILVPLSAVIVSLFDALFMLLILLLSFLFYSISVSWVFPGVMFLGIAITLFFGLGLGLFLGALNVKYRDVRHALPFIIQVLFFLSPVIYTLHRMPTHLYFLLKINPLSGVITGAQSSLAGLNDFPWNDLIIAGAVSLIFFGLGLVTFGRLEREFSDFI